MKETKLGYIGRLGRQYKTSEGTSILSDVRDFELPGDGHDFNAPPSPASSSNSVFSLKSAASSVESLSSGWSIRRLGSGRSAGKPTPERSSVLFDAGDFSIHPEKADDSSKALPP